MRIVSLLFIGFLLACVGHPVDTDQAYWRPIADAGEDTTLALGETAVLDGSGSEWYPGIPVVAYSWAFEATPPSSELTDDVFGEDNESVQEVRVEFVPDVVGEFVVSLTIDDGIEESAPDFVVVAVQ